MPGEKLRSDFGGRDHSVHASTENGLLQDIGEGEV